MEQPFTPPATGFVHLHNHTEHSMLDGMARIGDIFDAVAADGQNAVASTDHGNMSSAWRWARAARERGIKGIIGCEVYAAIGSRYEKHSLQATRSSTVMTDADPGDDPADGEGGVKRKTYYHLTLLAATPTGYRNLVAMTNKAHDSRWYEPRIDLDLLREHSDGIICLTGCLGGPVAHHIWEGEMDMARANLASLVEVFGPRRLFVEVMDHGLAQEGPGHRQALWQLADEFGLECVVTNDAHYVHAKDAGAHDAWLCLSQRKGSRPVTVADRHRFRFTGTGYHLRTEAEMRALHPEDERWQRACSMTQVVADLCEEATLVEAFEEQPRLRIPHASLPDGVSADEELFRRMKAGAVALYGDPLPQPVRDRLTTELGVIAGKQLSAYFLIAHDMVVWAKRQGRKVGPGRGSAAGSLTSYVLGLVALDPLRHDLLFERFLEPERKGMPDIDFDFERLFRGDVIGYMKDTFGADHVARIGTFAGELTKRSLRDAARVLGAGVSLGDRLCRLVPMNGPRPYTFAEMDASREGESKEFFAAVAAEGPLAEEVVSAARAFEGTIPGYGIHACGLVISDEPLTGLIPLRRDRATGDWVTWWDGPSIDEFGLLKLDLLGLRNLDIIHAAEANILASTGERVDAFSLPDPDTVADPRVDAAYRMLAEGRTAGVFQLESDGMADLCRELKPHTLEELSAVLALYRPGPMSAGMHTEYVRRKHGQSPIDYTVFTSDPVEQQWIASVLAPTYGLFAYQEQLMRLGTVIGGFTAAQRSTLRKAVGKKKADLMEQAGRELVAGASRQVVDEFTGEIISPVFSPETAQRTFELMKGSAEYLFNKSHSVAYAYLSYITAYLKANWPAEYAAALLAHTEKTDKGRRLSIMASLKADGVIIEPPSINTSMEATSAVAGRVSLGLGEIKDVGKLASQIVQVRQAGGTYASVADLVNRVGLSGAAVIALAEAGALDEFGPRAGIVMIARAITDSGHPPIPTVDWEPVARAAKEAIRLGMLMGPSPLDDPCIASVVAKTRTPGFVTRRQEIVPGQRPVRLSAAALADPARRTLHLAAVLSQVTVKPYSKGQMASMVLTDGDTELEAVMFDDALSAVGGTLPIPGSLVAVAASIRVTEHTVERVDEHTGESSEVTVQRTSAVVQSLAEITTGERLRSTLPPGALPTPDVFAGNALAGEPVEQEEREAPGTDAPPSEKRRETGRAADIEHYRIGEGTFKTTTAQLRAQRQRILDALGLDRHSDVPAFIRKGLTPAVYRYTRGDTTLIICFHAGDSADTHSEASQGTWRPLGNPGWEALDTGAYAEAPAHEEAARTVDPYRTVRAA